jgi:hypothetical protein
MRFSILHLMIAVVIVAGLLSLPSGWRELAASLALLCIELLAAGWLLRTGRGRLAGYGFSFLAISSNALFAALCVTATVLLPSLLCLAWFFYILPPLAAFGSAWAILDSRGVVSERRRAMAWTCVAALTMMPLVTALRLWPFHLSFQGARPALERLADRVAAGQSVAYPVWAGPFKIAGSTVDPVSGNVALMIDPNPNGPSSFIRAGTPVGFECYRPVRED